MIAMAAKKDLDMHQVNAVSAYLQAKLDEEIYMTQIPGFEDGTNRVLLLLKSLYGLKQAGHEWNKLLDKYLKSLGYIRCETDPCAYWRIKNGIFSMIGGHVDDMLMIVTKGHGQQMVDELKEVMEIKDLGQAERYLGVKIEHDRKAGTIKISQPAYIDKILEDFQMTGATIKTTPGNNSVKLSSTKGECHPDYNKMTGQLQWLATMTRPDIAYAVNLCARFNSANSQAHMTAVRRIYAYLKGTKNAGITYRRDADQEDPIIFSDSDHAAEEDRRSISGYIGTYAGGAFCWASTKQTVPTKSTMEAEYIAMCNATRQLHWYQQLMEELGEQDTNRYIMKVDNRAAKAVAESPATTQRSKHIDIAYHYTRRCLELTLFSLCDVPSESNIADLFTKALSKETHTRLARSAMGYSDA